MAPRPLRRNWHWRETTYAGSRGLALPLKRLVNHRHGIRAGEAFPIESAAAPARRANGQITSPATIASGGPGRQWARPGLSDGPRLGMGLWFILHGSVGGSLNCSSVLGFRSRSRLRVGQHVRRRHELALVDERRVTGLHRITVRQFLSPDPSDNTRLGRITLLA